MKLNIDGQEIEITFVHQSGEKTEIVDKSIYKNKVKLMDFKAKVTYPIKVTSCLLTINGKAGATGRAICLPPNNFCYSRGRRIALTQAVQFAFTRPQRVAFWKIYWETRNAITKKKWVA